MTFLRPLTRKPARFIAILAFLQVLTATYFLRIDGFFAVNSVLFLLSGFGIGLLLLKLNPAHQTEGRISSGRRLLIVSLVAALLLPVSYFLAARIIAGTPLQKEYADMLPIMEVMGRRFLDGNLAQVYSPIPEIWDGIQPIYLPAFWLPFTTSVAFHFDARWVTVIGIWLSVVVIAWPLVRFNQFGRIITALSVLILLVWLHFDKVNNVIRLSEEGVVFFYYAFLIVAIVSGRPWLVGIAAACCLLSRYALIGWIPFALLYLLFARRYRYLAIASLSGLAVILVLVIIPFGWKPFGLHLQLHADYIAHATRIWKENPEYFYHSLGMAKFFGPNNVRQLHFALIAGSFLIPLCFTFLAGNRHVSMRIAFLSCLQCTITFFYSFIDVSYLYLYYTPVVVSLLIAAWASTFATRRAVTLKNRDVV